MKQCLVCKLFKDPFLFGVDKRVSSGRRAECNICRNAKRRAENGSVEGRLRIMRSNAKAQAARGAVGFELTHDFLKGIAVDTCPVFGTPLNYKVSRDGNPKNDSASLDKLIPEKGYVRDNVNIISYRANRIKNDASLLELEQIASWMRQQLEPPSSQYLLSQMGFGI